MKTPLTEDLAAYLKPAGLGRDDKAFMSIAQVERDSIRLQRLIDEGLIKERAEIDSEFFSEDGKR